MGHFPMHWENPWTEHWADLLLLRGRGLQISIHNILLLFHKKRSAWHIHLERAGSRLVFYLFGSSEKDSPPRDRRSHRLPLGWDKIPLGLHHQPQKSQQKSAWEILAMFSPVSFSNTFRRISPSWDKWAPENKFCYSPNWYSHPGFVSIYLR